MRAEDRFVFCMDWFTHICVSACGPRSSSQAVFPSCTTADQIIRGIYFWWIELCKKQLDLSISCEYAFCYCVACSVNCLSCTTNGNNKCDVCASGYILVAGNTCSRMKIADVVAFKLIKNWLKTCLASIWIISLLKISHTKPSSGGKRAPFKPIGEKSSHSNFH